VCIRFYYTINIRKDPEVVPNTNIMKGPRSEKISYVENIRNGYSK
jgi:hypothetical protein